LQEKKKKGTQRDLKGEPRVWEKGGLTGGRKKFGGGTRGVKRSIRTRNIF